MISPTASRLDDRSYLTIVRDPSERRGVEAALHQAEARLRLAVAASKVGLWDWDLATNEVFFSPEWKSMLGYASAEIPNRFSEWEDRVHPDDLSTMMPRIRDFIAQSDFDYSVEFRMRHKDGSYRWILAQARIFRDATGKPVNVMGCHIDITERKQAEEQIRNSNRTYAVLSEINQLIVRERNPQSILNGVCRIVVEKGGFLLAWVGLAEAPANRVELTAHAGANADTDDVLADLLREPDCAFTTQAAHRGERYVCNDIEQDPSTTPWRAAAMQRGYRSMVSLPFVAADGCRGIFCLYAGQKDFFSAEELQLLNELAEDISFALKISNQEAKRQQAEEALHETNARFRQLIENIREVLWMTDPANGAMYYVSPAYEAIWGRRENLMPN